MSTLKTEEVLEAMLRARFQYEGYDAAEIEKRVAEVMAFPESIENLDDYSFTYEKYWDEAAMILDWIEEYEPEARAVAELLLKTPQQPKFNDDLIEDALFERHSIRRGGLVKLIAIPTGLVTDLPPEDIEAIQRIVGKPVQCSGGSNGTVCLDWQDEETGDYHSIWVDDKYVLSAP